MFTETKHVSRRQVLGGVAAGAMAASVAGLPSARRAGAQDGERLPLITVGLGADPLSMLPNSIVDWTTDIQLAHMYDRLMNRDPALDYEIGPWLGDVANIDDLTWEFTLASPDIAFHNGNPLTAEAIKAAFDYAKDPANESHYLERWAPITGIEVIDDLTVRLTTEAPYPEIRLRLNEVYPIDPAYLEEVGLDGYRENPVGTGPFTFVEWERGQHLILDRNPDYWRQDVMVDRVEFRFVPEFSSRLAALLADEINIVKDVPVDSLQVVNDSGVARIEGIPSSRINYVALVNNREDSIFTDPLLRQAVNYGVDVDGIIAGVFQGNATRMSGALSGLNPEVNSEVQPYAYDPERARALIEEAGYQPGEINVVMDAPQGRYPMDSDAAQAIAASLSEVGINVQVQYNEWGTHLDKIVNRQTGDMFYLGWGPALDALGTLAFLFVGDSTYSSYTNPEVEAMIAEASSTLDDAARQEIWNQVQQVVSDEAAWLFLWQQHDLYGVSNQVAWTPRPDEFMWMGDATPSP
ncbi:MAG: hypothetical protein H0V24_03270 [Chloroflexia bacterium]|nr:hypothetical protein [Chloroflexia bacterium]